MGLKITGLVKFSPSVQTNTVQSFSNEGVNTTYFNESNSAENWDGNFGDIDNTRDWFIMLSPRSSETDTLVQPTDLQYRPSGFVPWSDNQAGDSTVASSLTLDLSSTGSGSASNNDTSWTASTNFNNAACKTIRSTGKWYFEIERTSGDNMPGLADTGHSLTTWVTDGGYGVAPYRHRLYWSADNGSFNNTNVSFPNISNTVFMLAVDFDNRRVWVGMDGVWYFASDGATNASTAGIGSNTVQS